MTLGDFYKGMNVNYQNVLERLVKEARILRYLQMLLKDTSIEVLEEAILQKRYQDAFSVAHTLKGVCENLELQSILIVLVPLVEDLRSGTPQTLPDSFHQVKHMYFETINQIKQIESGD